ncbi:MAG: polyprenyl synthetase family protein [Candidatus Vogelbacteria bacterium]|nr:polyprenyl synthetase family protein [Candidatus Vogelbacteria bacterium]
MDIQNFKKEFDSHLESFLAQKIAQFKNYTKDPFILETIAYPLVLIRAGGKRIRPYLAYLAYKNAGGRDDEGAMRLFAALEIFHLFALVHDDIIDRSAERHGILTTHKFVVARLKKEARSGDHGHIANSIAILVGDLLFAWSVELLTRAKDFGKDELDRALAHYYRMTDQVLTGQLIDVDTTTRRRASEGLIEEKMFLKSASYSFVSPLKIGTALAGGTAEMEKFCDEFGRALGLAFQIQDDLHDLTLPPKDQHTPSFTDLREHQHTLFTQYIFENGKPTQKEQLDKLLGSPVSESDRGKVLLLFTDSGAIEYGTRTMEKYFKKSEKLLEKSPIDDGVREKFTALINFIRARTS